MLYNEKSAKRRIFALLFLTLITACHAAESPWNGKKAAISLTYDDALNVHLDNVVPVLNRHHLYGTFYVTAISPPFRSRLDDWSAIATSGHELANHTLFHPCAGNKPGRSWLDKELYLNTWTRRHYLDNLTIANTLLEAVDGQSKRSFAYPCGDTEVDDKSYIEDITPMFTAARGVAGVPPTLDAVDLMMVPSYAVSGATAEELVAKVDAAIQAHTWLVFLFHGVGGEHNINVAKEAHDQLVEYLAKHQADVWVAPVTKVAEFVAEERKK